MRDQYKRLKLTAGAGLVFSVLIGFAGLTVTRAQNMTPLPDDPLEGRGLFASKSCVRCHGLSNSGLGSGPSLGEGHFRGSLQDLGAALWNHAPQMGASFEMTGLPWPELDEQEATQLLVFLYFIDYLGRPGDPERGSQVFSNGGCDSCHNLGGGRTRLGPDLADLKSHASPLAVAQGIWNHGPAMLRSMRARGLRPPQFEAGDLAALSAYIRQQAGSQARRPLLLAPGNPNRGRELFSDKGCSRCHGRQARGGAGGPDLTEFELQISAEAIAGTMWNHALVMNQSMREMGIPWPHFEGSELADLVSFLYFLPFQDRSGDPQRGREIFATESCSSCHSGSQPGNAAEAPGPDLTRGLAENSPSAWVASMWNHAPLMKKAILGKGQRWPGLTGKDLRDLIAFLEPVR